MPVTVQTPRGIVDALVDGWVPEKDEYLPFLVRVIVIPDRPPRDEYFEYFRDMGMMNIDKALYNKPGLASGPDTNLIFFFPERHMTPKEQQMFSHALANHDETENIASVDIITGNPLILSDYKKEQIRIIRFKGDEERYL